LTTTGERRLTTLAWSGGPTVAANGETVNVLVSDSYTLDPTVSQRWADFFAGLVHGSELALFTVYVATPAEVSAICGGETILGCYGSDRMVIPSEPASGVDPQEIARHEYGHHIAFHRLNPPWQAVAWGTKRWASYENVCSWAAAGLVFPGDEREHYRQNSGEAFAETYRMLNDQKAGVVFGWPIVDTLLYPDATALQAVEQDVLQPWAAETVRTVSGRFTKRGAGRFTLDIRSPLDGSLAVALSIPKGGLYDLTLLTGDSRTVLARGLWSGTTGKTLSFTICGQRNLLVRVTRVGAPGRFTLRITQP
jgi:hypothetical protein